MLRVTKTIPSREAPVPSLPVPREPMALRKEAREREENLDLNPKQYMQNLKIICYQHSTRKLLMLANANPKKFDFNDF